MFLQEDDKFRFIKARRSNMQDDLPPGVYKLEIERNWRGSISYYFVPRHDYGKGKVIDCGVFKDVQDHINTFLSESQYKSRELMGMKHKLGLILNGEPGTGKTFIAGQIAQQIAKEQNGIGIITTDFDIDFDAFIDELRECTPDKFMVLILDEFEKSGNKGPEFLGFMDGPGSKNNMIVLATVNSTKKFDSTILNRPGRFEETYTFNHKDELILRSMIKNSIPEEYVDKIDDEKILIETRKLDHATIDHIRILIRNAIANFLKEPIAQLPQLCSG